VEGTDSATTNGSTTDGVWTIWVSGTSSSSNTIDYVSSSNVPVPLQTPETEEQKQARLEREQRRREERQAAERKREVARKKAEKLLRESLDKKQREQFNKTKWFFVVSESGKRYRIRRGWVGNVDEINQDDMVVATYCIHPQMHVPIEDSMLIQKLMLEADESRFKQVANRDLLRTPRPLAV
jgi:type IV secretory pathway VirB10-like protein